MNRFGTRRIECRHRGRWRHDRAHMSAACPQRGCLETTAVIGCPASHSVPPPRDRPTHVRQKEWCPPSDGDSRAPRSRTTARYPPTSTLAPDARRCRTDRRYYHPRRGLRAATAKSAHACAHHRGTAERCVRFPRVPMAGRRQKDVRPRPPTDRRPARAPATKVRPATSGLPSRWSPTPVRQTGTDPARWSRRLSPGGRVAIGRPTGDRKIEPTAPRYRSAAHSHPRRGTTPWRTTLWR